MSIDRALIASILDYLTELRTSASAVLSDPDSLDVAVQCLSEATGVNVADIPTLKSRIPLQQLFQQHSDAIVANTGTSTGAVSDNDPKFIEFVRLLKSKDFFKGLTEGSQPYNDRLATAKKKFADKQFSSQSPPVSQPKPVAVTAEAKAQAEKLKNEGNALLSSQRYADAIGKYSDAITLNPTSAIYFANRAAARINLRQYSEAESDCRSAIEIDEQYAKAHYRLGQALFNLDRAHDAIPAYERALSLTKSDPAMSETIQEQLDLAKGKVGDEDAIDNVNGDDEDDVGSGAGGFDFNSLLSNPMVAQMAQSLQSGAGGLDFNALLSNPAIQQMAQNLFSGGGFGGAPAAQPQSQPSMPGSEGLSSFLNSPAAAQLANDPDVAPVLEDIRANGQSAMFKHMGNAKFMSKVQSLMKQHQ